MIAGLKLAKGLGAQEVALHSDSELAVRQINDECRVIDDKLKKYHDKIRLMQGQFRKIEIQHVSRNKNNQADAFSKLGAAENLNKDRPVIVMDVPESSVDSSATEMMAIDDVRNTWFTPMRDYLNMGTLPENQLETRRIKKIAPLYSIFNGQLYKRGYLRQWLKCVREDVAQRMLDEVHEGICGSHPGAKTLAKRVLRAGFYWPTMQQDAIDLLKKCEKCQFHSKLNNSRLTIRFQYLEYGRLTCGVSTSSTRFPQQSTNADRLLLLWNTSPNGWKLNH